MSARIAEAAALSPSSFRKRYRSSYKTPSPSSSLTLLVQKRYRGTSELILDTDSKGDELGEEDTKEDESSDADDERESQGLDDEGQGLEDEGPSIEKEEEAAPKGQQQAVSVANTAASEPLGLGYGAARRRALESTEEIAPSTYEVGQSSRFVPDQEGLKRISAFRQPTLVTYVDPKDGRVYTDIPTYVPLAAPVQTPPSPEWSLGSLPVSPSSLLELHRGILQDHTQRLDALPPTLFEGHDKDLMELYTRSGVVRDEIFLQRSDWTALRATSSRGMHSTNVYPFRGRTLCLKGQLAEERRERLELTNRVARMERRQEFGGE
ncbi:hypothetical protein Tco_0488234 [Tanacetum coccineum]